VVRGCMTNVGILRRVENSLKVHANFGSAHSFAQALIVRPAVGNR
jgi:hypothetical protein